MTCEEFIKEVDRLLQLHGGSYQRPSGWLANDGLSFSCVLPPVIIPADPRTLTNAQRRAIEEGLAKRLERQE
jgi:hypothetical protein